MTVEHGWKLRRQKQSSILLRPPLHTPSLLFPGAQHRTRPQDKGSDCVPQTTAMDLHVLFQLITCGVGWGGAHTGARLRVRSEDSVRALLSFHLCGFRGPNRPPAGLHSKNFTHCDISQAQKMVIAKTHKQKFLCPPRSYLQSIAHWQRENPFSL